MLLLKPSLTHYQPPEDAQALSALSALIDQRALRTHVERLAHPRSAIAEPLQNRSTAEYLATHLESWGYKIRFQGPHRNVVAHRAHSAGRPLLIGAHYDSEADSPGADDNASSLAIILELARAASRLNVPQELVFVAFNTEEDGLLGSCDFVENDPLARRIEQAHILEMVGFTAPTNRIPKNIELPGVNSNDFLGLISRDLKELKRLLHLAKLFRIPLPLMTLKSSWLIERRLPDLLRSDHVPFWRAGLPAVLWTDTGNYRNPNYHLGSDLPHTLNYGFMRQVAALLLSRIAQLYDLKPSPRPRLPSLDERRADLTKRLRSPQRHRLLQGFPMLPIMRRTQRHQDVSRLLEPHIPAPSQRPTIVGILPHTFCNPRTKGCGFCTFPHQSYRRSKASDTVAAVAKEIEQLRGTHGSIEALYLGGGTANLTPASELKTLLRAARAKFDLRNAEITLEGAPAYFVSNNARKLRVLRSELPTDRLRISMGVQTFETERLAEMGRAEFGAPKQVEAAVRTAASLGFTTSVDMLINLPGQTSGDAIRDLERADALGVNQICLYHLVLFEGLDVPWAHSREKLVSLPSNSRAYDSWREARRWLIQKGYAQKTLTNFERPEPTDRRFLYEQCSFQPERYDALGFGPAAITTRTNGESAIKWVNTEDADEYTEAIRADRSPISRHFLYASLDLRLLHVTRKLPLMSIDRTSYRQRFGSCLIEDFAAPLSLLEQEGLLNIHPDSVRLTEKGMFYADTVAGALAWDRFQRVDPQAHARSAMG